jgi:uncharacterized membrane-anchored protein
MQKQFKIIVDSNRTLKRVLFTIIVSFFSFFSIAQEDLNQIKIDSIENSFHYENGTIYLDNGVGKLIIPKGFKYLSSEQAERVLVDLWGNPKSDNLTLGLILPEKTGVLSGNSYVFNIQYDEIGYVKDDDADDINYDELLTQMKEESVEENKFRIKEGYDSISVIGWAAQPYYDKEKKILYWAKEFKFGKSEVNTLNYNIRILGRKGVLELNAIATTKELDLVQTDISKVLNIFKFNDGYKYEEFDSSIDEVAAWTIGGLVAGKVLAKVGLFAVIAKFGKVIFFLILGLFGTFRKKLFNLFKKKKENETKSIEGVEDLTTNDQ